jgi:hypothetical protein
MCQLGLSKTSILRMLLAITLLSLVELFVGQTNAAFAQGSHDYCQYGKRTVLIFVDRTTAYDDIDKKIFVDGFDRIMARLNVGDNVVVHTIQDKHTNSSIVFNACLPGCPDEGFVNWLVGSCKSLIARGAHSRFRLDLAKSIRDLLDHPQSFRYSEIVRTLINVTNTYAARARNDRRAKIAQVFVFSDLLENSTLIPWRILKSGNGARALQILNGVDIRPAIAGARVATFGFGRNHGNRRRPLTPSQDRALRKFWQAFFKLGSASDVYIGQYLD